MNAPIRPSENIDFSRFLSIAQSVAKHAGWYIGGETFLGYRLKSLDPLLPEHQTAIPLSGLLKIVFEQWTSVTDCEHYSCEERYKDPETITHRVMCYEVSAENLLKYETWTRTDDGPIDPVGDLDILDWDDVSVSSGEVPDEAVTMLCEHLKTTRADYLEEEYMEAYQKKKLPKWDPRITKVVREVCKESIRKEKQYEARMKAETPAQKMHREESDKTSFRMASMCWITKEIEDTHANIRLYKNLRDNAVTTEDRERFQSEIDYLFETGMVTKEDFERCERIDQQAREES